MAFSQFQITFQATDAFYTVPNYLSKNWWIFKITWFCKICRCRNLQTPIFLPRRKHCQSYILSCLILCWWLNIMKVFSVESLQFWESFPCVQSSNQFIFYFSSLWEPRWTSMKLIYEGKLMCNTHFRKQYTHCIYSEKKTTIFSCYLWKVKI